MEIATLRSEEMKATTKLRNHMVKLCWIRKKRINKILMLNIRTLEDNDIFEWADHVMKELHQSLGDPSRIFSRGHIILQTTKLQEYPHMKGILYEVESVSNDEKISQGNQTNNNQDNDMPMIDVTTAFDSSIIIHHARRTTIGDLYLLSTLT